MDRPDGAPPIKIRWDELEVNEKVKTATNFIEWEEQQQELIAKQKRAQARFYETEPTPKFQVCDLNWCTRVKEPFTTYRGKKVPNKFCSRHEERWRKFRARKFTIEQFVSLMGKTHCDCCGIEFGETQRNVDHDHAIHPGDQWCPECYRGIVCITCNLKLQAIDDPNWLDKATRYIEDSHR